MGEPEQAFPSSLSSQARGPMAFSALMPSARPAAAWAIQLEVFAVTSVLPFPEAVCLEVEDLYTGIHVVFGTCCCCCHLWFSMTISKVWCPPQHYLCGPAVLGLVTMELILDCCNLWWRCVWDCNCVFLLSCQFILLSCWLSCLSFESRQLCTAVRAWGPHVWLPGLWQAAGSVSEPNELLALGNVPEPDAGRAKRCKSPCGPALGTTFSWVKLQDVCFAGSRVWIQLWMDLLKSCYFCSGLISTVEVLFFHCCVLIHVSSWLNTCLG